jgi:hypothetical protein
MSLPVTLNPAAAEQFVALTASDVLQLKMVAPFCNDKNPSALATGLTAASNAADPNTVTSVLFMYLSSSGEKPSCVGYPSWGTYGENGTHTF